MDEADVKRKAREQMKVIGGWAKRIEDKYLVGFPDMLLKLPEHDTVLAEFKVARGRYFSPTPRQLHELKEYERANGIALVVGCSPFNGAWYLSAPTARVDTETAFRSLGTFPEALRSFLNVQS